MYTRLPRRRRRRRAHMHITARRFATVGDEKKNIIIIIIIIINDIVAMRGCVRVRCVRDAAHGGDVRDVWTNDGVRETSRRLCAWGYSYGDAENAVDAVQVYDVAPAVEWLEARGVTKIHMLMVRTGGFRVSHSSLSFCFRFVFIHHVYRPTT